MKSKLNNIIIFFVMTLFITKMSSNNVEAARATYYRGSFLMWTRDNVDFEYNKKQKKVTYSSGYQKSGWIFPNISRNKGIVCYYRRNYEHKYRATNVIGAGVPTPWGDVKVYNSTFIHRLNVRGNGSWSAYSD